METHISYCYFNLHFFHIWCLASFHMLICHLYIFFMEVSFSFWEIYKWFNFLIWFFLFFLLLNFKNSRILRILCIFWYIYIYDIYILIYFDIFIIYIVYLLYYIFIIYIIYIDIFWYILIYFDFKDSLYILIKVIYQMCLLQIFSLNLWILY